MKRTILAIASLLTALFLASCGQSNVVYDEPHARLASSGRSWTVLVYMCGGSEETENGSYSKKLEEITSVEYPENIHTVIETGGSTQWHKKGVYNDYLQRFEAGKDKLYLADQSLSANMGEHQTLLDFLSWGVSQYKSDHYMVVLAGSGGGSMSGMCSDEQFEDDCLSLSEISYALSGVGKSIDAVMLDASLMGTLETASALGAYTDYLIAPQDIIGADDVDYAAFLQFLCQNPSADGKDIGKVICDSYYNRAVKQGNEKYAAMSVIDMSEISTLNQAFDGMAGDMVTATDSLDNYINLSKALSKTHIYGGATVYEGFSDLIDLGDAAVKIGEYVGGTADMLIETLNNTIVYRVCGEYQSSSTGMGFFYPLDQSSDRLQQYMDMSMSSKYREYLRKVCISCSVEDKVTNTPDYNSSWAWTSYSDDMAWLEYKTILDGVNYELDILGNMNLFTDIGINVYKLDADSGEYVFIGKYKGLESNWEAGIFKDNFNGNMPRIAGKDVSMTLVRSYDDYDLYSAPLMVNGTRKNVRVRYDSAEDKYDIIGVWNGLDDKGQVSASGGDIGAFDRVAPVLGIYDSEHKTHGYVTGNESFKLGNGAGYGRIDDGNYIFEYELTDIYGQKRHGTPVKFTFEDGRIIYE